MVRYDGVAVASWDQLTGLIRASGGQATPVVVQRDGQEVELTVTPVLAQRPVLDDDGEPVLDGDGRAVTRAVGFLGVTPTTAMVPTGVGEVPQVVAERTWQTMSVVATLPARMVDLVETTFGQEERGTDSIVGIVGVGRFAGEIASYDADGIDWGDKLAGLLEMLAALNLALFVFNLIPLPPLDGATWRRRSGRAPSGRSRGCVGCRGRVRSTRRGWCRSRTGCSWCWGSWACC